MSELIHNHLLGVQSEEDIINTDYIGFTYNGIHSSELGIVRVSEGNRYNDNLFPVIQDKTNQIPGGDGTIFYGSYYTQKQFNISIAFDNLTEEQYLNIQRFFGDKKIHEFIYDETPFKAYYAKTTGNSVIKHIPFEEGETNRVYKGEGSIQFTAYSVYAHSVHKYLNEYKNSNIQEWKQAANLLEEQGNFDIITEINKINLYNPGVKDSPFVIRFNFNEFNEVPSGALTLVDKEGNINQLHFSTIKKIGEDEEIAFNSKINLIEGYKNGKKTGNIYNRYITKGAFFNIPQSTDKITPIQLILQNDYNLVDSFKSIEYNYFYF